MKQWFQSLSRKKKATIITFLFFITMLLLLIAIAFMPVILLIVLAALAFGTVWTIVYYDFLQIKSRISKGLLCVSIAKNKRGFIVLLVMMFRYYIVTINHSCPYMCMTLTMDIQ